MAALPDWYERSLHLLSLMLPTGTHNVHKLINDYQPRNLHKAASLLKSRLKVSFGEQFI